MAGNPTDQGSYREIYPGSTVPKHTEPLGDRTSLSQSARHGSHSRHTSLCGNACMGHVLFNTSACKFFPNPIFFTSAQMALECAHPFAYHYSCQRRGLKILPLITARAAGKTLSQQAAAVKEEEETEKSHVLCKHGSEKLSEDINSQLTGISCLAHSRFASSLSDCECVCERSELCRSSRLSKPRVPHCWPLYSGCFLQRQKCRLEPLTCRVNGTSKEQMKSLA